MWLMGTSDADSSLGGVTHVTGIPVILISRKTDSLSGRTPTNKKKKI